MRDKISFEPNVPVTVTLQYQEGKIVDGRFGQQVMFSLSGNQIMYLDLAVAQKVNMLEPAVGESFAICKRSNGQRGQPVRWDVWLTPETEKFRAAKENPGAAWNRPPRPAIPATDPPSELEQQLDRSLAEIQARKRDAALATRRPPAPATAPPAAQPLGTGTNGPVAVAQRTQPVMMEARSATKLEDALKTVVAAVFSAQEYAKQIGYAAMPQFSAEDIRIMANTLIIDGQRNGGSR